MPFAIKAEIKGAEQLVRKLRTLEKKVKRQTMRKMLRAGADVILQEAKRLVPVRYGELEKSLGVVIRSYKGGLRMVAVIGPRAGRKVIIDGKPVDPANYAHLVEMGVGPHAVGRGSKLKKGIQSGNQHPGAKAQPFLRPAVDSKKGAALAAMTGIAAAALGETNEGAAA